MVRVLVVVGMALAVAGCKKKEEDTRISAELVFSGPGLDARAVEKMQRRLESVGLKGKTTLEGGKLKVVLTGLQTKVASERFSDVWRLGGKLELYGLEDATSKALCAAEADPQVKTEPLTDKSTTCYLEGADREALLKKVPESLREKIRWGHGATAGTWRTYLTDGKPFLTGAHVKEANVVDGANAEAALEVVFDEEGTALFAKHTELLLDLRLAIVLDDVVMTAPTVMDRIPTGRALITLQPGASKEEASLLALAIQSGELSGLKLESETNVKP